MSPPFLRMAATSSARAAWRVSSLNRNGCGGGGAPAQKKDSPSVLRGKKMLLAMPTFEKGFPTSVRAYASIVFSSRLEQPMLR